MRYSYQLIYEFLLPVLIKGKVIFILEDCLQENIVIKIPLNQVLEMYTVRLEVVLAMWIALSIKLYCKDSREGVTSPVLATFPN